METIAEMASLQAPTFVQCPHCLKWTPTKGTKFMCAHCSRVVVMDAGTVVTLEGGVTDGKDV